MTRRPASLSRFPWRVLRGIQTLTWVVSEHRRIVRTLPDQGVETRATMPPARMPLGAGRLVILALRARRATCLERSLILQAWLSAHGRQHDVVIGVRREGEVTAHAWVEGVEPSLGYVELHRLTAGGDALDRPRKTGRSISVSS